MEKHQMTEKQVSIMGEKVLVVLNMCTYCAPSFVVLHELYY